MKTKFTIIYSFLIALFISINFNNMSTYSIDLSPKTLVINATKELPTILEYFSERIHVKKIISNIGIGYSLDIDKDYPKGQTFNLQGTAPEVVENTLYFGYPCKTYLELNLLCEDDAYFATQIALWVTINNLDLNELSTSNIRVLNAINNICNEAQNISRSSPLMNLGLYSTSSTTQQVVLILK